MLAAPMSRLGGHLLNVVCRSSSGATVINPEMPVRPHLCAHKHRRVGNMTHCQPILAGALNPATLLVPQSPTGLAVHPACFPCQTLEQPIRIAVSVSTHRCRHYLPEPPKPLGCRDLLLRAPPVQTRLSVETERKRECFGSCPSPSVVRQAPMPREASVGRRTGANAGWSCPAPGRSASLPTGRMPRRSSLRIRSSICASPPCARRAESTAASHSRLSRETAGASSRRLTKRRCETGCAPSPGRSRACSTALRAYASSIAPYERLPSATLTWLSARAPLTKRKKTHESWKETTLLFAGCSTGQQSHSVRA